MKTFYMNFIKYNLNTFHMSFFISWLQNEKQKKKRTENKIYALICLTENKFNFLVKRKIFLQHKIIDISFYLKLIRIFEILIG